MVVVALLMAAAAVALTYPTYQASVRRGREALPASSLITGPRGTTEFASVGSGPAVLVVHGAGGGYDQGLLIAETFIGDGYHIIAPSRFGYLRTSVPRDGSPAAQADAYAALLDHLDIKKAAVVAFSDGGPSALQFALRYPDRISALVMLSAKSQSPAAASPAQEAVFEAVFRSDYIYWAVSIAARPLLVNALGVSAEVQEESSAAGRRLILTVTDSMNPISLRRDGIYHDRATLALLPADAFELERIGAATLVLHAEDDGLQSVSHARHTAARISGAELVIYERGGHLLSLQIDEARERVRTFLDSTSTTFSP
jgi:pimeloyl-ACP methyl ester carboxylesterase